MKRIVSLIPSSTEIACALGFENQIVGRSHECDYPLTVKELPVCTEPKIDVAGSSLEIDNSIKALLKKALSVYRVHEDKLKDLQPEFILTQDQCDVCAVNLEDVEKAVSEVIGTQPKIVSLSPNTLEDVWKSVEVVASALKVLDKGKQVVSQLKERVEAIHKKSQAISNYPRVICVEWIEPLMAAGNWIPEMVKLSGGNNLFGKKGEHSTWIKWQDILEKNPDVLIFMPCGFDIQRTLEELKLLTKKTEWENLNAVKNERIYVTDGNQYFNRPGPRLVESLEILAEIIHPKIFNFGHEGVGWQNLSQ